MNERTVKGEFGLSILITDYEIDNLNNEMTIIFSIAMYSSISNKDWVITRTLLEFKNLNSSLKGLLNVPSYPLLSLKSDNDVNILRLALQNYLQDSIEKPCLINSLHFKNFLELENHLTDYMLSEPLLLSEISDSSMEVSDIHFSKDQNLLFAGYAYSSATGGISSYLTSISSLWNNTHLGGLSVYHLVKSNYGEIHTHRIFNQVINSQVSKLNFLEGENLNILLVALFDGAILMFRIYTGEQTHSSKTLVEQIAKLKPHKHRVIDFGIEPSLGYVYSAAYGEKNIVISEMNYESVIASYNVSNNALSNFMYDRENKRIFVTDVSNSLWILIIENNASIKTLQAIHNQIPGLSCMRIEPDRNFIFLGSNKGVIRFADYDDQHSMGNMVINQRLDISIDSKVTDIKFRSWKSGLITALANGSIAFWGTNENYPEFLLGCHEKSVNRILYDDSIQILFTCSSDKHIKIWQLPKYWPSQVMREDKEYNERSFIEEHTGNTNNIMKIQDAINDMEFEDTPDGDNYFPQKIENKEKTENSEKMEKTENSDKEEEIKPEEIELIDGNYIYDHLDNDTYLDGWENDSALGNFNKNNNLNRIYDFIGI